MPVPQPQSAPAGRSQQWSHQSYDPPEPPSGGDLARVGWALSAVVGLGAVYYLGEWAARAGQRLVEWVFGGGSGSGGGGPPCGGWPEWLCSAEFLNRGAELPLGFQAAALLLLFLLFLAYWIYLLFRLPLVPTWQNHKAFRKVVKPSPLIIVFVVAVANSQFLMTELGWLIINARVWTAFITALIGCAYLLGVGALAPKRSPAFDKLEHLADVGRTRDLLQQLEQNRDRSRAPVRYGLTLLFVVYILNMGAIALSLIPNTLAAVPPGYNWWCILWPFGCDL